jgi:hypothetical protein
MTDTDTITLDGPSLAAFLDRLGLPASARTRVIAIDRELAGELEKDDPDADGCAALVFEAADLIGNSISLEASMLGWEWGADDPGDVGGFDFDGVEWGDEDEPAGRDFAERMFDLEARLGGDSDWGEGGVE